MALKDYGEATIVIPFTFVGGAVEAAPVARMSRLRARGALFRGGVASADRAGGDAGVLAEAAPAAPVPLRSRGFDPEASATERVLKEGMAE